MLSYASSAALLASAAFAASKDYTENGANWTGLCATGTEQSPIDLTTDTDTSDKMEVIGFDYFDFRVANNQFSATDTTYTATFSPDSARQNAELQLTFADGSMSYFTPLQFHFHAPSEHSVDGQLYDLEVHFVHTRKGSNTGAGEIPGAVIGVFFDTSVADGTDNAFLDSFFKSVDTRQQFTNYVGIREFLATVDMADYWSYDGSLTTPPCTEGIKWSVIKEVQPISAAQLLRFTSRMSGLTDFAGGKGNNRVVQNLNQRTLYYSGAAHLVAGVGAAAFAVAALAF